MVADFCPKTYLVGSSQELLDEHCVKSVRIPSYSGPYSPAFGMNTERYWVTMKTEF